MGWVVHMLTCAQLADLIFHPSPLTPFTSGSPGLSAVPSTCHLRPPSAFVHAVPTSWNAVPTACSLASFHLLRQTP